MHSKKINLRVPPKLMKVAEAMAKAEGVSVGEWTRRLIEKATGVEADIKRGMASLSKTKRKKLAAAGGRAKAEARKASE